MPRLPLTCLSAILLASAALGGASENLVAIPGFEDPTTSIGASGDGDAWVVAAADGRIQARVPGRRQGVLAGLDPAAGFVTGARSLRVATGAAGIERKTPVYLYGIPPERVAGGGRFACEVWIRADRPDAKAALLFEGSEGGRHVWREQHVAVGREWRKHVFTATLPAGLADLHLRIDLMAGATFWLDDQALVQADQPADAAVDAGNQLVNGGAERGWYATGVPTSDVVLPSSGVMADWMGQANRARNFAVWTIDGAQAHSGTRSFRADLAEAPARPNGLGPIFFNPVACVVGRPMVLSAWMKADRPTEARLSLFVSSGIAYERSVRVGTDWSRHEIRVPSWGAAAAGAERIGDVSNGYGAFIGMVTPKLALMRPATLWVDDVACRRSLEAPAADEEPVVLLRGQVDRDQGYYVRGEAVGASLEIENPAPVAKDLVLATTLLDYFGTEVARAADEPIHLAAGETIRRSPSLPPPSPGVYGLICRVSDPAAGRVAEHAYYYGVIDPPRAANPRVGLDLEPNQNVARLVPYLRDFAVGSVRVWSEYTALEGGWPTTASLPELKRAGLYVLYCINTMTPAVPIGFLVPRDMGEWKAFLGREVARQAGMVDCYELMNEPNIWSGRCENPDDRRFEHMSPDSYLRMLAASAEVIRAAAPRALIGGPTTCHTDVGWTTAVLRGGGDKLLDVITEHPYRQHPEAPDYAVDLLNLRKAAADGGRRLPVIGSECGWTTTANLAGQRVNDQVRQYVAESVRIQVIGFAGGLERFIHYRASLWPTGTTWSAFLLGNPGNRGAAVANPLLFALRTLSDRIGDAPCLGQANLGSIGRCYVFEQDGHRVAVFWKCELEDTPSTITLHLPASAAACWDIVGAPVQPERLAQGIRLPLSGSLRYLQTDLPFDDLARAFASAEITGTGRAFTSDLRILGPDRFAIEVHNRGNRPMSGTVEVLSADLVAGDATIPFAGIAGDGRGRVEFATRAPIGPAARTVSTRTVVADEESFETRDFDLRAMLCPRAAAPPAIDGDLADWPAGTPVVLGSAQACRTDEALWSEADRRITATIRTCWDPQHLYVAIDVAKPVFHQSATEGAAMWQGDSVQVAFDPLANGNRDVQDYGDDDFEYTIGRIGAGPRVYRHHASNVVYDGLGKPIGTITDVQSAIVTRDGHTIYELAFPTACVSPFRLVAGNSMRWSLIANLNNGMGRMGWLELTPGIGQRKSPGEFMGIILQP